MKSELLLNLFLSVHFLILLAAALGATLRWATQKGWLKLLARHELHLHHALLVSVLLLPVLGLSVANRFHFQPVTKTYAAATYKEFDSKGAGAQSRQIVVGSYKKARSVSVENIQLLILAFLVLSMFVSIVRLAKEAKYLRNLLANSMRLRRHGKIIIAFSDQTTVPFSLRTLTHAWTLLPTDFAVSPDKMKISIYHEFQHHRQGDTLWLPALQGLKAVAGLNPALHFWFKTISEVQELKVDESLVDQGKVEPREYARCLIEVAESVARGERQLVCAAGLAFLPDRQLLKRRIESMFKEKKSRKISSTLTAVIAGAVALTSMTALALTAGKAIGTRVITRAQAEELASVVSKDSGFPVVVNDLVLEQLNRFLGTAQGREFIKNALVRLESYRPMIEAKIKSYGGHVPEELLAVPVIESGYQNLQESSGPARGAGLWQFIPSTARKFGMRVDATNDDRLNVEQETDAAIRYLYSNQLLFGDWALAAMAYNMGENAVDAAITQIGSRDPWALVRAGREGDHAYLAKVVAAILIMKNPSLVE